MQATTDNDRIDEVGVVTDDNNRTRFRKMFRTKDLKPVAKSGANQ